MAQSFCAKQIAPYWQQLQLEEVHGTGLARSQLGELLDPRGGGIGGGHSGWAVLAQDYAADDAGADVELPDDEDAAAAPRCCRSRAMLVAMQSRSGQLGYGAVVELGGPPLP